MNALDVGLAYTTPDEALDQSAQEDEPTQRVFGGAAMRLNFEAYAETSARDRTRIRTPTPDNTTPPRQTAGPDTSVVPTNSTLLGKRITHAFQPMADFDLPQHLVATDTLMRTHLGTGLDGIRAVLGTAVDWTPDAGVAVTDTPSLAHAAEDWSGLPRTEIDAAVALLSLDAQNRHQEAHRYWEVERRSFRLRTRPFPVIGGQMWIMPWAAAATQELFSSYFHDSRLPYTDPALPPTAANAMRRHRQTRNRQLEFEAGAAVQSLGLPYRLQWSSEEARSDGLADLPGEVDLLVADMSTSRLWVCEIKDPETAFAPAALRRHIERFVKNGGYVDKLLNKAQVISQNPAPAARACGIQDARAWQVIPLMMTRRVEPAAFLDPPPVAFTVLEDLPSVLTTATIPRPGHADIGGAHEAEPLT